MCIKRLAQDDELRNRLRDGGRKTAAAYPAARFAERTVEEIVGAAAVARDGIPVAER
jgi:hypothetical protein